MADAMPGIHTDVPMSDYLALPYVSNSRLKLMGKSPAHYQAYESVDTDATTFGTFSHCVLLEPTDVLQYYAVLPDIESQMQGEYKRPKATKEYREAVEAFASANAGKTIIEQTAFDRMQHMMKMLRGNDTARKWLNSDGDNEVTIIWDDRDTGIRCRGRIDILRVGFVGDYKSTVDVIGFDRQINKYGYHRQLAMYVDAMEILTGDPHVAGIIAQEKERPFSARAALLSEETLAIGRAAYKADLVRLAECVESDSWPGPDNPEAWELPPWAMVQSETVAVDFSGVPTADPRPEHDKVGF